MYDLNSVWAFRRGGADVGAGAAGDASEVLQYEVEGGVATIWLNRPEVKNCINWELLMALGAALERAEEDDDVRVVVLRGRGNTFCAGADLNARFGVPGRDQQLGQDRPGLRPHVRPRLRPHQADHRRGRGLRRRRRLRALDLLRLLHHRRRRADRRLPHPPRPVRRRRPHLPPPALHRPAQDQGAALHGQAPLRHGRPKTGAWPTCPPSGTSSIRRSPTSSPRCSTRAPSRCGSPSSPPTAASTATRRR